MIFWISCGVGLSWLVRNVLWPMFTSLMHW